MQFALVLFALSGVALFQDAMSDVLLDLVIREINAMLSDDPNHMMSPARCAEKCDAAFAMTSQHGETLTTHLCHTECERIIHELRQK